MAAAKTKRLKRGGHRFGLDFGFGLVLFAILSLGLGAHTIGASRASGLIAPPVLKVATLSDTRAAATLGDIEKAAFLARDQSVARLTDEAAMPWLTFVLGLTFAGILAFNLAIARHLRRVHASPRRRS